MAPMDRPAWFESLQTARLLSPGDPTRASLERARLLIENSYDQVLDLDRLAAAAAYSPYHFHRLFRQAFGDTPHGYLTRRRISAAKHLLETTDLSVTEVALRVGFTSLGSFSSLFARVVGYPPGRYRRRVFRIAYETPGARIPGCFAWRLGGVRV